MAIVAKHEEVGKQGSRKPALLAPCSTLLQTGRHSCDNHLTIRHSLNLSFVSFFPAYVKSSAVKPAPGTLLSYTVPSQTPTSEHPSPNHFLLALSNPSCL